MTNTILFALLGNENISNSLAHTLKAEVGDAVIRRFPDGESFIKINSTVKGKNVLLVCSLNQPDDKLLPLYFISKTLKEFGALQITLIAPYLAYMRQDKRFNEGESVTSALFASLISSFIDKLITVDPHLHRRSTLNEIYTIPTVVLHAAPLISDWIRNNIPDALVVGPDEESEQWVSVVAKDAGVPYIVLEKVRHGDSDVEIKVPDVSNWKDHTPVLVDDIISTGNTMIETIKHLLKSGYKRPKCIGVHGIFADKAFDRLLENGANEIITTNTINHSSNYISVADLIVKNL